jgi:hypothetical protein
MKAPKVMPIKKLLKRSWVAGSFVDEVPNQHRDHD